MRRVHEEIDAAARPAGSTALVAFTWHGQRFQVVRRQPILKPSPRLEFAHQLVVAVGGDTFEVHCERPDGRWYVDTCPDAYMPAYEAAGGTP
jgi:hypothetical protein